MGVECENPEHPVKYYGSSATVQELSCPDCAYVVSDPARPDLGSMCWCKKCVEGDLKVTDE